MENAKNKKIRYIKRKQRKGEQSMHYVRELFSEIYGKEVKVKDETMMARFYEMAEQYIISFIVDVIANMNVRYRHIAESHFYSAVGFICEMFEKETGEHCTPEDILIHGGYAIRNEDDPNNITVLPLEYYENKWKEAGKKAFEMYCDYKRRTGDAERKR